MKFELKSDLPGRNRAGTERYPESKKNKRKINFLIRNLKFDLPGRNRAGTERHPESKPTQTKKQFLNKKLFENQTRVDSGVSGGR